MNKDELNELRKLAQANGSHAGVTDPEAHVREIRGTETERDIELREAREDEQQNFTLTNFIFQRNEIMADCEGNLIDVNMRPEPPKEV